MERFFKSINYIENNLGSELTLELIAQQSHYSTFHFARMFRAVVGDSVMGYIQRRRLSESARRISSGQTRLIDIAMDFDFGSHEAFSRAFKKLFGVAPQEFRGIDQLNSHLLMEPFSPEMFAHITNGIKLTPRIDHASGFTVVGLKGEFDDDNKSDIPVLWQKFFPQIGQITDRMGNEMYGVSECYNTLKSNFSYSAGVKVRDGSIPKDGLQAVDIPASLYATFDHQVRRESLHLELQRTMKFIWGTWFPGSKYEFNGTPDFELYGDRFDGANLSGVIEIHIPIREMPKK